MGVLLAILIAFNAITSVMKQRVDLTKEKAYTLSDGTRAILRKLDAPVKVHYYCSSSSEGSPESVYFKTYARRVADLLEEYKQAGNGKLIVEQFDPKPDSNEEDSAHLDGVEGQLLRNGEKFYLGLSVNRLDEKQAIAFLDPNRERMLEYDLSRAITRVANPERPVVGVMSGLPVFGRAGNPMMARMGQQGQGQPSWQFIEELKVDCMVREVGMTSSNIPEDIKVLVVIHPKEITDAAQFAIDQFVLRGGKLIAFLDSTSLSDSRTENPMMGAMPGGGSSLDKLIKAWGLQFDNSKTVADKLYKVTMRGRDNQPVDAPTFLNLVEEAINTNDIVTSDIKDVWYPFGGVFSGVPAAGLKLTALLKSSKESQLVDGFAASFSGESIMKEFKSSGTEYSLAVRLSGKFKTAFPDGRPKDSKAADKAEAKDVAKVDALKESNTEGVVVLFGDADMLADQFCVRQRQTLFGPMGYEAANGNLALLQNLVDQMAGDSNLIRVRSRAAVNRPFTRIKNMEAKAQENFQSRIQAFEKDLQETQAKVNELQSKKEKGEQRFILSPEQQAELEKFKKKSAEVNISLKKERKNLTREITSLENTIKWGNIIGMPALVAVTGVGLAFFKRKRTSAK